MSPLSGQLSVFEAFVSTLWAKACPLRRAELAGAIQRETARAPTAVAREAQAIIEGLARQDG